MGDSFFSTINCFWKRSPVEFLNSLTPGRSSLVLVSVGFSGSEVSGLLLLANMFPLPALLLNMFSPVVTLLLRASSWGLPNRLGPVLVVNRLPPFDVLLLLAKRLLLSGALCVLLLNRPLLLFWNRLTFASAGGLLSAPRNDTGLSPEGFGWFEPAWLLIVGNALPIVKCALFTAVVALSSLINFAPRRIFTIFLAAISA